MTLDIKHLFHIAASKEDVYKAISTKDGLSNWWTTQVEGESIINSSLSFSFGEFKGPKMKVIRLIPNENITWECIESEPGWVGNKIEFALDENDGKTRLRFTHDGWLNQDDFYAACCFSWGKYLESLRQYCQTGIGEAFGSINYRK